MAETNNGGDAKKKGLINKIVGAVLLVVVVLAIIFLSKGKPSDTETVNENTEESSSEENNDGALEVLQPVQAGDYEYEFSGVKWIFDTESAEVAGTNQTWLKMEFADFTRNGSAISFGRPYKLGVHPGTCKEVNFIDLKDETGIPFAYAECSDGKTTREFVVLQESENVVVKMNEKKDGVDSGWKEWYKINVTEIVR